MKVYVVQADNCEEYEDFWHWTEGVFSSKELAEQYILEASWSQSWRCCRHYWIEEYEMT